MRVHLTEWEWACCGDPFEVGDHVELNVTPPNDWVRETYGDLGIDAVETHHEIESEDAVPSTLTGRVASISALYLEHSVRREMFTPEQIAANRLEWERARASATERAEQGAEDGMTFAWFAYEPLGREPAPYSTVYEPIPGAVRISPIDRVPPPPREDDNPRAADDDALEPVELLSGYLVELDPLEGA